MSTDIKDCPFCGSAADVQNDFGVDYWVQCTNLHCGSVDGTIYGSPAPEIERWNRRPTQAPSAPRPMSEHNARFAIDGAIQFGREDRNKPPTDDHWLMEYWLIGQQLRELGKTGWDNRTPLDPAERVVVVPSAPVAPDTNNDWLVKNLLSTLSPAIAHGSDVFNVCTKEDQRKSGFVTFYWPGCGPQGEPSKLQWIAIYDAATRVIREYKPAQQARAALSVKAEECTWTPTADNWETGAWDSSCGETWLFTDGGTPSEHNVKFCQGCGKPVAAPTPPTTGEA